MMKQILRILFIFLGTLCLRSSAFARMPKPFLYMRTTIKLDDKVSPNNADVDNSLFDAEEAAAIDSHDLSDPGLEAAAMERAVMMAEEYKQQQLKKKDMERSSEPCVGGAALIRSLDEQNDKVVREANMSTDDESLFEAEEAAAIDAHDVNDSGLEAAAMERAVMMAEEFKEQQMKKKGKNRADRLKAIEEHYIRVKRDIEAIQRLIKEADDADHASVRRTMLVSHVLLIASTPLTRVLCNILGPFAGKDIFR